MKEIFQNQDVKKIVCYSADTFIIHIGSNYEEVILRAEIDMKSVITVKNINDCNTSIPLERALNLLEKYYKLSKQPPKKPSEMAEKALKDQDTATQKDAKVPDEEVHVSHRKNIRNKPALADSV